MKKAKTVRVRSRFKALAVPAAALILQTAAGVADAAPVTYSFSTGANPFGSPGIAELFFGSGPVSGTFEYDPLSPFTNSTPTGASVYGIQSISPQFPSSFANLSGTVAGFSFSDARGTTLVGNENLAPGLDILQLNTQSTTPTVGFSIGGYTLQNVRMFWIEGQQTPGTVPDFLADQSLPGVLPGFQGRLAFDFVPTGGGAQSFVFYDGLTVTPVPEPETYAMLMAGLGLLAFTARRRRQAA
jgi:hypothetical protein